MRECLSVGIAKTFDEIVQAIAIRSAVYVGEQGWPFAEEWDGNDFTATHFLAKVNGDSAGSLRVRYFGDFVKFERLAVLPKYRQKRYGKKGVAFALGDTAIDFCLKKGFTRFYGHALQELVPFWGKIGRGLMKPVYSESFDCNGKTVVPMYGEIPPPQDRLSLESGHYVLVRPEGDWDKAGFWEQPDAAA
ncbi:MAG: GNAT family N-acetyltransferase [Alphaproteobacteria bacterium]